jgi:hypothetical protein
MICKDSQRSHQQTSPEVARLGKSKFKDFLDSHFLQKFTNSFQPQTITSNLPVDLLSRNFPDGVKTHRTPTDYPSIWSEGGPNYEGTTILQRVDYEKHSGLRRFMTFAAEGNKDEEEMSTTSSTAGGAGRIFPNFVDFQFRSS